MKYNGRKEDRENEREEEEEKETGWDEDSMHFISLFHLHHFLLTFTSNFLLSFFLLFFYLRHSLSFFLPSRFLSLLSKKVNFLIETELWIRNSNFYSDIKAEELQKIERKKERRGRKETENDGMQKSNDKIEAPKEIIFEGFNLKERKGEKERKRKGRKRNRKERQKKEGEKVSLLFSMFVFDLFFPFSPFFR